MNIQRVDPQLWEQALGEVAKRHPEERRGEYGEEATRERLIKAWHSVNRCHAEHQGLGKGDSGEYRMDQSTRDTILAEALPSHREELIDILTADEVGLSIETAREMIDNHLLEPA